MNVCLICQADGVLTLAGQWYCIDHLDEGFKTAAAVVHSMRTGQHDPETVARKVAELDAWLAD